MRNFWQEIRYAVRVLAKSPGFAIVAVLTLSLGIGANTAIFSFVNAALLKPLPYASPDRLFTLGETREQLDLGNPNTSYPDFQDWQRSAKSFSSFAGFTGDSVTVSGTGMPENVSVARVTPNFFSTLGVTPILGSGFPPTVDGVESPKVALLTHQFWKSHFGSNRSVVGQTVHLDGALYTIIGVLPANFEFAPAGSPRLWLSLNVPSFLLERRNLRWMNVIGRLQNGVSPEQAAAEMHTLNSALMAAHPVENGAVRLVMRSLRDRIVGQVRPLLFVLLGAVAFVLLIACANVAHLMLARATTRKKEIAVRVALGASRFQLIRQLLTESLVLSLLGGSFGLLWATWGIKLLLAIVPEHTLNEMPFLGSAHTDLGALLFLLAVTLLSASVFGIMPALQMSKTDCSSSLKEEGRTSASKRAGWLRDGLVVAELAVSIVLLTGAGLMVRSLNALLKQNPGFDGRNLLTFVVSLPDASYKDNASILQFESRFSNALKQLPGVQGTAVVSRLPVMGSGNSVRFVFEGRPKATGTEDEANIREVTPAYFPLMKIPVLQGRNYGLEDDAKAPPRMVVNQAFVDRYLAGEDPIGKRLRFTYSSDNPYMEIIGVVSNENSDGLDAPMKPILYSSFNQGPDSAFYLVIRAASDPIKLLPSVRGALHDIDPEIPIIDPRSMEQVISDTYAVFLRRFPSRIVTGFASLALLLAIIGLYGQISFSVTQRTREIGVRMALGARSADVLRLIVGKGIALTLGGLLLGFAAALALTRLLTSLLFGITPSDPWTLTAVAILLASVSIVASLIPARRATRVDPMVALRYE